MTTPYDPFTDSPLAARITAHRGFLILHARSDAHPALAPINPQRVGTIVLSTGRNLGVSDEAMALLRTVGRSKDSIGDVMWFTGAVVDTDGSDVERPCFGWLGGNCVIRNAAKIEGDRRFAIPEWVPPAWVTIANESDPEAVAVVDGLFSSGEAAEAW